METNSESVGSLRKIDCESLNTLVHQYDKCLEENYNKKIQFEKFKEDYTKLKDRLKTLPNKLEYEALVPIASKALCPGKLIHTNEILCLLGENTFVECTAVNAIDIVKHRLKNVNETLNNLKKEQELYNSWKFEAERQMVETLGEGTIEIIEDYDEEKEKKWREEHREKVRKYHQELAAERKKKESTDAVNNLGRTEEDQKLWTRLDALELEEEFMEAQALYEEKQTNVRYDESHSIPKIRESKRINQEAEDSQDSITGSTSGKKVTFNPEKIIHKLDITKASENKKKVKDSGNIDDNVELYKPTEVSENGLHDPIFIRFKTVSLDPSEEEEDDDLVSSSSDNGDDYDDSYQIVISPGDIYEQFGPPSLGHKCLPVPGADKIPLKSILKPNKVSNSSVQEKSVEDSHVSVPKKPMSNPITLEIVEKIPKIGVPGESVVNLTSTDSVELLEKKSTQNNDLNEDATTKRPKSLYKRMREKL